MSLLVLTFYVAGVKNSLHLLLLNNLIANFVDNSSLRVDSFWSPEISHADSYDRYWWNSVLRILVKVAWDHIVLWYNQACSDYGKYEKYSSNTITTKYMLYLQLYSVFRCDGQKQKCRWYFFTWISLRVCLDLGPTATLHLLFTHFLCLFCKVAI